MQDHGFKMAVVITRAWNALSGVLQQHDRVVEERIFVAIKLRKIQLVYQCRRLLPLGLGLLGLLLTPLGGLLFFTLTTATRSNAVLLRLRVLLPLLLLLVLLEDDIACKLTLRASHWAEEALLDQRQRLLDATIENVRAPWIIGWVRKEQDVRSQRLQLMFFNN